MTPVMTLFLGCLLVQAQDEKPTPLKYLRPDGDKYVLESEITVTPAKRGWTYTSTTHRTTADGDLTMQLTIQLDAENTIQSAEAVLTTPKETKQATLTLFKDHARLKRGGTMEILQRMPAAPRTRTRTRKKKSCCAATTSSCEAAAIALGPTTRATSSASFRAGRIALR